MRKLVRWIVAAVGMWGIVRRYGMYAAGGLAIAGLCAGAYLWATRGALADRVKNETVRLPLSPPNSTPWTTVNAFGDLRFFEPTCIGAARDGSGRMYVLERQGTVQLVLENGVPATKRQVLDFSRQLVRTPFDDDGALGLVLHPEFGRAGSPHARFLYIFYTADVDGQCFDRLARFTVSADGETIDPRSELVLIDQKDDNLWHNGGGLAFGPDGFLYVGVGDEGTDGDALANGQRIDRDFFSGILRIDVDRIGGEVSHAPPRQPDTGTSAHYFVPRDNPFMGVPGALEEFWSIGLRNPHRFAFDRETGRLWVGDVGHLRREEINIATRGSNHGWSYREGHLPFTESYLQGRKPTPFVGVETPPIFEYPHLNGNNCVIGGVVYRGTNHPELVGKYLYADNGSGRIFALDYDGERVVSNVELTSLPVIAKTGISSINEDVDGEPLIVVLGEADQVDGKVYRLVPAPPGSGPNFPPRLSETGIFADLATLSPSPGLVPYDVNSPLWSDGAVKRRWILLPGDGADPDSSLDRIEYCRTGDWKFPAGTIFVKHFELPVDETEPSVVRRLETRLLVRDATGGAYGVTYKWNEEGKDAVLLADGLEEAIPVKTASGETRNPTWVYPSQQTCLVCHTETAGHVLGVSTRQLNGEFCYPDSGRTANQLREWSRIGMFSQPPDEREIENAPRLVAIDDQTASLEHRVRSYLDANCASCHRPGGVRANFDARFETPLAGQNLLDGPVNSKDSLADSFVVRPGDPSRSMIVHRMLDGTKPMPPVGVKVRDQAALAVICEWIDSLPAPPDVPTNPDGYAPLSDGSIAATQAR